MDRALVTVVPATHVGYLTHLALGGFLAVRGPGAFWPHLAA